MDVIAHFRALQNDNPQHIATRVLAREVDQLVTKVPKSIERTFERDVPQISADVNRGVDIELNGRAKIRVRIELQEENSKLYLLGSVDYRERGRWKHLTIDNVNGQLRTTLDKYYETAIRRDAIWESKVKIQNALAQLSRSIIDLQRKVRANPANTIQRHDLGRLLGQRAIRLGELKKLDRDHANAGKTLKKQLSSILDDFYLTLVGAGLHEIASFHYSVESETGELCGSTTRKPANIAGVLLQ